MKCLEMIFVVMTKMGESKRRLLASVSHWAKKLMAGKLDREV